MTPGAPVPTTTKSASLAELASVFLKLGTIAFGGPAAHVAMMRHEVVEKRSWVTESDFLDLLSATNFIPGPNSTEMSIHIGHRKGGWRGLIVAGCCFILPAALIVASIAWAYVRFGSLPQAEALLAGVKPAVIAIIVQALWKLGRVAVRNRWLFVIAIFTTLLAAAGLHELLVLLIGGASAIAATNFKRRQLNCWIPVLSLATAPAAPALSVGVGVLPIFLSFAKIGSILFGSGYVLLAFLRADFVERYHWITEKQLLDGIAVGQITPGPLFTTATFIGYLLCGGPGALAATVGIFLPAFFFVAVSAPLLPVLRRSETAGSALDGVNVASLALMVIVTWELMQSALVDWFSFTIALISALLLFRFRTLNSAWLVLAAAICGILRQYL